MLKTFNPAPVERPDAELLVLIERWHRLNGAIQVLEPKEDAESEKLLDVLIDLQRTITNSPSASLAGLCAKAVIARGFLPPPGCCDRDFAASVIDDVIRLLGVDEKEHRSGDDFYLPRRAAKAA